MFEEKSRCGSKPCINIIININMKEHPPNQGREVIKTFIRWVIIIGCKDKNSWDLIVFPRWY